jgi:eukaryotic-like serine/threonine-protein kinase
LGTDSRLLADGRYELFESIGSGGMATVYRAHDRRLGVDRAIKVLSPGYASKPTVRARFEAEARTMAVLDHPNIVRVYDVGSNEHTAWIVMELIDGPSLLGRIKQRTVGVEEALQVTESILMALSVAHAHGVVHRDIKPHNVLISKDGKVRITDFGIARSGGSTEDSFTKTGTVMGTWAFMAPEQRVNAKGVDHTADIYGMGATLFAMATGDTPMDLFASDLDPDMLTKVPDELVPLIRRATRYQREERYPNAQAMLEAVDATRQRTDETPGTIRTPRISVPPVTKPAAPIRARSANSAPTVPDPESPTNVTYVPDPSESTEGKDDGIDVTVTPLPFRPQTPQPPTPDTHLYPPVKSESRKDRTLLWIILILVLLVGGAVRRALRVNDKPANSASLSTPANTTEAVNTEAVNTEAVNTDAEAILVAAPPAPPVVQPTPTPTPAEPVPDLNTANVQPTLQAPPVPNSDPTITSPNPAPTTAPAPEPTPTLGGQPDVEHAVSGSANMGDTLAIQARIANMRPLDIQQYEMRAYFRASQTAKYRSVNMTRVRSTWTGGIPIGPDMEAGLEYFIKAKPTDSQEGRLTVLMSGNNRDPHSVRITSP